MTSGTLREASPWRVMRSYRRQRHYSGWYWFATTGRLVCYESRLELARLVFADFDPVACDVIAQPFLLTSWARTRVRRHVPDFALFDADGAVTVVDVKPRQRLADELVAATFAWTRAAVEQHGWAFEVWSEPDPVVYRNLQFLAGYRRPWVVDGRLAGLVLDRAAEAPTIGALEASLTGVADPAVVRPVVLHLLWTGALSTDLRVPLGGDRRLVCR